MRCDVVRETCWEAYGEIEGGNAGGYDLDLLYLCIKFSREKKHYLKNQLRLIFTGMDMLHTGKYYDYYRIFVL